MKINEQRFRFNGGDGDQRIFSHEFTTVHIYRDWFKNYLPRGEAYLLLVENGPLKGMHLAITSRVNTSLQNQIMQAKWISVVVHVITNPGDSFVPNDDNADPIGMAAIEVLQ